MVCHFKSFHDPYSNSYAIRQLLYCVLNLKDRQCQWLVVMVLGQKYLTRAGSIFCCSGQVGILWFGFGKFPLKISAFSTLYQKNLIGVGSKSTQVKGGSTSYLLWVKSMLVSGQGPSLVVRPEISFFSSVKARKTLLDLNTVQLGFSDPTFLVSLVSLLIKNPKWGSCYNNYSKLTFISWHYFNKLKPNTFYFFKREKATSLYTPFLKNAFESTWAGESQLLHCLIIQ